MISLKVKNIVKETADAVTIQFERPTGDFNYLPGQFVTLYLNLKGESIKRSYSFSSSPFLDYEPAITVKKVEGGKVSSYLVNDLKIGDIISAEEPLGNFCTEPKPQNVRTVVLLAGGSGITPLFSMAKSILSIENNTKVYLIYANRSENDIIFRKQIADLQTNNGSRFHAIHTLSQGSSSWYGLRGRVTRENMPTLLEQLPVIFPKNAEYFICGPEGMMNEVVAGLKEIGVAAGNINKERFTHAPAPQAATVKNISFPVSVEFTQKGVKQHFKVKENQTLLEGAKEAGIRIRSSCETGVCTSCMCTLTDGEVDMGDNDTLTSNEIAKGFILTCISYPKSQEIKFETEV